MYRTRASLFAAAVLGLALAAAIPVPVDAQRSDDGAGNAPPTEVPRGGGMPDATAPMDPPMPSDENAGRQRPKKTTRLCPKKTRRQCLTTTRRRKARPIRTEPLSLRARSARAHTRKWPGCPLENSA